MKKALSVCIALMLLLSLAAPALASENDGAAYWSEACRAFVMNGEFMVDHVGDGVITETTAEGTRRIVPEIRSTVFLHDLDGDGIPELFIRFSYKYEDDGTGFDYNTTTGGGFICGYVYDSATRSYGPREGRPLMFGSMTRIDTVDHGIFCEVQDGYRVIDYYLYLADGEFQFKTIAAEMFTGPGESEQDVYDDVYYRMWSSESRSVPRAYSPEEIAAMGWDAFLAAEGYTAPAVPEIPAGPAVVLSPQRLVVNGAEIACMKYNIDGSNYFKLRDLACLLNGTGSRFSVGWDAAAGIVSITTGAPYTEPNGTELVIGADESATAQVSAQTIMIDGAVRGDLSVWNIGGSNYFKLRELGDALGFGVDYDAAANTAVVTSAEAPTLRAANVSLTRMNHSYWMQGWDGKEIFVNCYYDLAAISDDSPLRDRINAVFYNDYQNFLSMGSFGPLNDGGYDLGQINYYICSNGEVAQNADGILSVVCYQSWQTGGTGDYGAHGITVSLATGERLDIADLQTADGSVITFQRLLDIVVNAVLASGLSRQDMIAYDSFSKKSLEDLNFYIRDNELVLCIHKYELLYGLAGAPEIPTGIYIRA